MADLHVTPTPETPQETIHYKVRLEVWAGAPYIAADDDATSADYLACIKRICEWTPDRITATNHHMWIDSITLVYAAACIALEAEAQRRDGGEA